MNGVMKTIGLGVLAAGLLVTQATAAEFKRIKSEAEYREKIAGHKFVIGKDHVTMNSNGKVSGRFNGKKLVGAWNWQKGYWCRAIKLGSKDLGSDCQVVMATADGGQFYLVRKQGKGDKTGVYTRK